MTLKLDTVRRDTYKIMLYGQPKTGKTTAGLTFPGALTLQDATARGADFLTDTRITISGIDQFAQVCAELSREKEYPSVVLDDFGTSLRRWNVAETTSSSMRDKRLVFRDVNEKVQPALGLVMASPRNVIVTLHADDADEVFGEGGRKRRLVQPWVPEVMRRWLLGLFDAVIYTYRVGDKCMALTAEVASDQKRIVASTRAGLNLPRTFALAELQAVLLKARQPVGVLTGAPVGAGQSTNGVADEGVK